MALYVHVKDAEDQALKIRAQLAESSARVAGSQIRMPNVSGDAGHLGSSFSQI